MMIQNHSGLLETVAHRTGAVPFSIHSTQFYPPSALYLHWHPELEFLIVEEGALQLKIETEEKILTKGEGIFIPPYLLHSASAKVRGRFSAFVFAPELIVSPFSEFKFQKYLGSLRCGAADSIVKLTAASDWQRELLNGLKTIFAIPAERLAENELLIQGTAMILWQLLYQNFLFVRSRSKKQEELEQRLSPAISYLHANFALDLTLQTLAELTHFSRGQFCRSFKLLTGVTPFDYLNRYRILQSCLMLGNTDKKISEISMLCGFETISYFNRKFMEITQMTPSQYRKNQLTYREE